MMMKILVTKGMRGERERDNDKESAKVSFIFFLFINQILKQTNKTKQKMMRK